MLTHGTEEFQDAAYIWKFTWNTIKTYEKSRKNLIKVIRATRRTPSAEVTEQMDLNPNFGALPYFQCKCCSQNKQA